MGRPSPYRDLYHRLLIHTKLEQPGNPQSCWLWIGMISKGYPYLTIRMRASRTPNARLATRLMLETVLGVNFPFDEAGHLCNNPACVNPEHLEVQTKSFNLLERRTTHGVNKLKDACLIPTLFPKEDELQAAADWAWDSPSTQPLTHTHQPCPF